MTEFLSRDMAQSANNTQNNQGHTADLDVTFVSPPNNTQQVVDDGLPVIFKLVKSTGHRPINIDAECDIFNDETQSIERARVISGVTSIWMKDQKNLTQNYVDLNKRTIKFESRIIRVSKKDSTLLQFMRLAKNNVGAPNRTGWSKYEWVEWDAKKVHQEQLKNDNYRLEAMRKAAIVEEDKMRKHGAYLGISPVDEDLIPKNADHFRTDYMKKAEQNPKIFMETLDSILVDISHLVKKAISDSKLDLGREPNKVYFSTGKFVCSVINGRKPVETLIELASSNSPQGKEFLDELKMSVGQ